MDKIDVLFERLNSLENVVTTWFVKVDDKVNSVESMFEQKFDQNTEEFLKFERSFDDHREETKDIVRSGTRYDIEEINVSNGGIAFQVNEGVFGPSKCRRAKVDSKVKESKSQGSEIKFKSDVFTYKWADKHPELVTELYQMLLNLRAIDKDTDHEEFEKLFLGEPTDTIIKWTAKKSALSSLMKTLKSRDLISPKGKIWTITQSHFKDKEGHPFTNLRNLHSPESLIKTINLIADVLDPTKKIPEIDMIDDDLADELWSGIHDRGNAL